MRRGHRLHSIHGCDDLEVIRFIRETSCLGSSSQMPNQTDKDEQEFLEFIRNGDTEAVKAFAEDTLKAITISQNWIFVRKCAKEVVGMRNQDMIRSVLGIMCNSNSSKAFEVGEIFVQEALNTDDSELVIAILDTWISIHGVVKQGPPSHLEIIQNSVYFVSHKRLKETKTLALIEMTIYCATVDKRTEVLEEVLKWHERNVETVGQSAKLNADCMIHAALEDDLERLCVLYSYGYRLGHESDRRITKDYLKRIKLFKARASPVYKSVVFENSKDIYKDDPLKKCFEYARQARIYASKIQDFTKEYMDIARKCEEFAMGLLDRCTTKHEVQMLLQTRSYKGHMDANFNIAILDGHKNFVAHEKFQQLLHKKWGQRDRLQCSDTPGYNIFWSEKSTLEKFLHMLKQVIVFIFVPFVYIVTGVMGDWVTSCQPLSWLLLQGQIPVNRFLYWEISKLLFYFVVMMTLVDESEMAVYDFLAFCWIISYLLENVRTFHRFYRYGGTFDSKRIFKRWLTFRNIYILATDIIFLVALVLRSVAFLKGQCRNGCPYDGNEIAYLAASVWSVAALLTFLRSIQGGLMWRQTGPVIISMSYMILDVLVFLFLFVIVYLSFTVSMVYVYTAYSKEQTPYFHDHKMAFKLFFWAMIRTGNPHYADIYKDAKHHKATESNSTSTVFYNASCLSSILGNATSDSEISKSRIDSCSTSSDGGFTPTEEVPREIDEGISYVVGNSLWAIYQFTVVIVLLSILRARMVNTYHRVFKEADVQWKYFRASIWWKYLDEDSFLPPPFTILYFLRKFVFYCKSVASKCFHSDEQSTHMESYEMKRLREQEERREGDKRVFERRYRNLMLMLIAQHLRSG